jgi:hypothetical protein
MCTVLKRTDTRQRLAHAECVVDRFPPSGGGEVIFGHEREISMLYTIAVVLLIAWLLGIVGTYTIGAFVHVLLVVALVLFVVGLLGGRRSLV